VKQRGGLSKKPTHMNTTRDPLNPGRNPRRPATAYTDDGGFALRHEPAGRTVHDFLVLNGRPDLAPEAAFACPFPGPFPRERP